MKNIRLLFRQRNFLMNPNRIPEYPFRKALAIHYTTAAKETKSFQEFLPSFATFRSDTLQNYLYCRAHHSKEIYMIPFTKLINFILDNVQFSQQKKYLEFILEDLRRLNYNTCSPQILLCRYEINGDIKAEQIASRLTQEDHSSLDYLLLVVIHFRGAIDGLEWMKSIRTKWRWNTKMCKRMMDELIALQKHDELHNFIVEMRNLNVNWSLKMWNSYLSVFIKKMDIRTQECIYYSMIQTGVQPNENTFECLIKGYFTYAARSKDANQNIYHESANKYSEAQLIEKVDYFLSEMKKMNLNPTFSTHEAFLTYFLAKKRYQKVLDYAEKLKVHGYFKNLKIYGMVLSALFKLEKVKEARDLYVEMNLSGLKPDLVIYLTMIKGYGNSKNLKSAVNLYISMIDAGIKPNFAVYTCLMQIYCRNGDMGSASRIWMEMIENGFQPTEVNYTLFIHGFGLIGDFRKALNTFEVMSRLGYQPNAYSYNALISCLAKGEQYEEALNIYSGMIKKGVIPNVITSNIIIDIYSRLGKEDQMLEMFSNYIATGNPVTDYSINPIIRYYSSRGNTETALEFSKLLQNVATRYPEYNPNPNVSNTIILQNSGTYKDKKLDTLSDVEFPTESNNHLFDIMLRSLGKSNAFEKVSSIFFRKILPQMHPDQQLFQTFILIMLQTGYIQEAKWALSEMLNAGYVPDKYLAEKLRDNKIQAHR